MCLLGNGVVPKTAERAEHGSGLCASSGRTWRVIGAGSPAAPGMPSGRPSRPSSALSTRARPCTEPCLVEETHLGDAGGFIFSCLVPTKFWTIFSSRILRTSDKRHVEKCDETRDGCLFRKMQKGEIAHWTCTIFFGEGFLGEAARSRALAGSRNKFT